MPRTTPLKLAILHSGMTQLDVARKAGLSQPVLNLIINGHKRPTSGQSRTIAKVLHVAQRDLFDREDPNG